MTDVKAKAIARKALGPKGYDYGIFAYENSSLQWRRASTADYYYEALEEAKFWRGMYSCICYAQIIVVDFYTRKMVFACDGPYGVDMRYFPERHFKWHAEVVAALRNRHIPTGHFGEILMDDYAQAHRALSRNRFVGGRIRDSALFSP